jgi:hypothetical protein
VQKRTRRDLPPTLKYFGFARNREVALEGNVWQWITTPITVNKWAYVSGVAIDIILSIQTLVPYTITVIVVDMQTPLEGNQRDIWTAGSPPMCYQEQNNHNPLVDTQIATSIYRKKKVLHGGINSNQAVTVQFPKYIKLNAWNGIAGNGGRLPKHNYYLAIALQSHGTQSKTVMAEAVCQNIAYRTYDTQR